MVEIMLAVIVIALGIAGTFILFPVGLNANKDATAENSIADIAEYIASFIQAKTISDAIDDGANAFKSNVGLNTIDETYVEDGFDVDNIDSNVYKPIGGTDSLYKHESKGIYLFRQYSGAADNRYVDFSAVARVYLDKAKINPGVTPGNENSGFEEEKFFCHSGGYKPYSELKGNFGNTKNFIGKFLLPVVIELSWPATAPYEDREKRYFRFEIFNDQYDPKDDNIRGNS